MIMPRMMPPIPFKEEGDKVILTGPVMLHCGCFTGDTLIKCSTGGSRLCERPIKDLYKRWESGFYEKHSALFVRGLQKQRVGKNKVLDIFYMGKRRVVKLTFADGTEIRCTPDHKFYTNNGWVEAQNMSGEMGMKDPVTIAHGYKQKKISDPRVCVPNTHPYARKQKGSNLMELHRAMFECYANGYSNLDEWKKNMAKDSFYVDPKKFVVHHIDGDHSNNAKDNLCLLTDIAHKRLHALQEKEHGLAVPVEVECVSVEDTGADDVYDIACETYNSYTANGFIVHNCGQAIARWATLQQQIATVIPQAKPKSSKIVWKWVNQELPNEKALKLHVYGVVVAETEKGFELVDILSGATPQILEKISNLIERHKIWKQSSTN